MARGPLEFGKPIMIEEAIVAYAKAKTQYPGMEQLPEAPISHKPDLIVQHGNAKAVVNVSHKTAGDIKDWQLNQHEYSLDTRHAWAAWELTRHTRIGKASWPMAGTLMNIMLKKTPRNEKRVHRYFIPAPEAWFLDAYVRDRQLQWWLTRMVPPFRSHKCVNEYGRACAYRGKLNEPGLCFTQEGSAEYAVEMARFRVDDFLAGSDPPTEFGHSRYEALARCTMQHHFQWDLKLRPVLEDREALDIGIAWHKLMARYYRGYSTEEEIAGWKALGPYARSFAQKMLPAYARETGGVEWEVPRDEALAVVE